MSMLNLCNWWEYHYFKLLKAQWGAWTQPLLFWRSFSRCFPMDNYSDETERIQIIEDMIRHRQPRKNQNILMKKKYSPAAKSLICRGRILFKALSPFCPFQVARYDIEHHTVWNLNRGKRNWILWRKGKYSFNRAVANNQSGNQIFIWSFSSSSPLCLL